MAKITWISFANLELLPKIVAQMYGFWFIEKKFNEFCIRTLKNQHKPNDTRKILLMDVLSSVFLSLLIPNFAWHAKLLGLIKIKLESKNHEQSERKSTRCGCAKDLIASLLLHWNCQFYASFYRATGFCIPFELKCF